MGSTPPFPIIPTPRKVELTDSPRRWPGRIRVDAQSTTAASSVIHFEPLKSIRQGTGDGAEMIVRLLAAADQKPEGYTLEFTPDAVNVSAADDRGFRHAAVTLATCVATDAMPAGRIEDWPRLATRGFHLNLESYRRIGIERAIELLETAARLKLNTVLIEYGPRFPFQSRSVPCSAPRFTPDEIASLNATAVRLGLNVIPLQQSLAHLEYLLTHPDYAVLREDPQRDNLICPSKPESAALVQALAVELLQAHPQCRLIHLGGDEARKIGRCTNCSEAVPREGVGGLYGRYMGDLSRWALEQGRRPIIWDDTICAHPEALAHVPKETIIAYWDYIAVSDPTPVLIPRMAHAAGGPRVAHHWSWLSPWRRRQITDVQADVMRCYSRPCNLKSVLGDPYLKEFGRCLGDRFPTWIQALPYIDYYREKGFDVICCPTGLGNGDSVNGLPNFTRFEANIRTHGARAIESGANGVITTAWYDMPPEVLIQPLVLTAQSCW